MTFQEIATFVKNVASKNYDATCAVFDKCEQILVYFGSITLLIERSRTRPDEFVLKVENVAQFCGEGFGPYFTSIEMAHKFVKQMMFSTDVTVPYDKVS